LKICKYLSLAARFAGPNKLKGALLLDDLNKLRDFITANAMEKLKNTPLASKDLKKLRILIKQGINYLKADDFPTKKAFKVAKEIGLTFIVSDESLLLAESNEAYELIKSGMFWKIPNIEQIAKQEPQTNEVLLACERTNLVVNAISIPTNYFAWTQPNEINYYVMQSPLMDIGLCIPGSKALEGFDFPLHMLHKKAVWENSRIQFFPFNGCTVLDFILSNGYELSRVETYEAYLFTPSPKNNPSVEAFLYLNYITQNEYRFYLQIDGQMIEQAPILSEEGDLFLTRNFNHFNEDDPDSDLIQLNPINVDNWNPETNLQNNFGKILLVAVPITQDYREDDVLDEVDLDLPFYVFSITPVSITELTRPHMLMKAINCLSGSLFFEERPGRRQ